MPGLNQTPDVRERVRNVARFASHPSNLPVLAEKVLQRFTERDHHEEATAWAKSVAMDTEEWAKGVDAELWKEAAAFGEEQAERNEAIVKSLGVNLGGGGHYPLAYFLVRHRKPRVAFETGVAAGWSSEAILSAMDRNGHGKLYSSDFPFFRLSDPEQVIGVLVDDELRDRWELGLDGDARNLKRMVRTCGPVGFFHYDSDKTSQGRGRALRILAPVLEPDALVMMDDIDNTLFFRDWVTKEQRDFRVFEFEKKYVGLALPKA